MGTKFHRIWFGDKPIPPAYEHYWAAWQRQFPDSEFISWTDRDIPDLTMTAQKLGSLASHVSRADLARYEILYRHGGIYLDCDIMPCNHFFPEELTDRLTVCNETDSTDYCSIGFIATPPGHPIFVDLMNHIAARDIDESRPNVSTGPWLFGAYLKRHDHRRLPVAAFYPYLYDEPFSAVVRKDLGQTLGIHVWGGSWLAPEQKKTKALQLVARGDIAEPAAILAGYADSWSDEVRTLIETTRALRELSAKAALVLNTNMSIDPAEQTVFDFAKVVHWLLERDPDRMVWQVGAADGMLVDPLRPAMVNFDPPAVLLEPNPYMYRALEAGYANNRNATLLPYAYGLEDGDLVLNAINPDKAAALRLPRWVLGISSVYDDKNAIGGKTIDARTTQLIQSCIERIAVPVLRFDQVAQAAGGRLPDVLVIDAEGMDKPIIDDVLATGCRPMVIHFEIQCMEIEEQQPLFEAMMGDYVLLQFGNDVTAYRNDVILDYARARYIDNGIPTIFRAGIRTLNGL